MKRRTLVVPIVALASLLFWSGPAVAATPRLPDLGMAPLRDFTIDRSTGARLLRFSTEIVNVGIGPFVVEGRRSSTAEQRMTVTQYVNNVDRTRTAIPSTATMRYSGDGHDHWHIDHLERYTITPLTSRREVGWGAKVGYCFFDTNHYRPSLPRSPSSPVHMGCGSQSSLRVDMGLSVGWGDIYPWYLAGQWIDLTGLANGDYIVRAQADPRREFTEANTTNNGTWTKIRVASNDQVTVLEQGPAA